MPKRGLKEFNSDEKPLNAVIIGAMTLLNKMQITPQKIKTAFKNRLLQEASEFDDIRFLR